MIELRLALDPAVALHVTTVGSVAFPMVEQQTGFAREEDLTLDACEGSGFARACTLHHRYGRFEAEPPAGKILTADEDRIRELTTSHTITATGLRRGSTIVEGPEPARSSSIGKALAEVHRLYCLRFPSEAIAVGAKWSDECSFVLGGRVVTQRVAWELSKIDDDPASGTRAELTIVGELSVPGDGATRQGTIQGNLFFFVDHGQPHLMRLRTSLPLKPGSKLMTTTSLNVQFAWQRDDGTTVRTDGQPFPPADGGAAPPPGAGPPIEPPANPK